MRPAPRPPSLGSRGTAQQPTHARRAAEQRTVRGRMTRGARAARQEAARGEGFDGRARPEAEFFGYVARAYRCFLAGDDAGAEAADAEQAAAFEARGAAVAEHNRRFEQVRPACGPARPRAARQLTHCLRSLARWWAIGRDRRVRVLLERRTGVTAVPQSLVFRSVERCTCSELAGGARAHKRGRESGGPARAGCGAAARRDRGAARCAVGAGRRARAARRARRRPRQVCAAAGQPAGAALLHGTPASRRPRPKPCGGAAAAPGREARASILAAWAQGTCRTSRGACRCAAGGCW